MKSNLREFAVKVETTPGTAVSVSASDVHVRLRPGTYFDLDVDVFDPEELQSTSSSVPVSVGRKLVNFPTEYVLRAPGDLTTTPEIADLFGAALLDGAAAKTIAIGAVTSGPFTAGETITGGTSSATGIVIQQTANGASTVPYLPVSGTMQTGETITGGSSGASATTSGTPQNGGYVWRPVDISDFTTTGQHVTCKGFLDGYQVTARGCLADLSIAFEANRPALVTQNFAGVFSSSGDAALPTGVSLSVAATAPKLCNAAFVFGSYTVEGVNSFNLNWPTNPTPVIDANSTAGDCAQYMDYRREAPTITIDPSMVLAATYDYMGTLTGETITYIEWTVGDTSGNRFTFVAPTAQLVEVGAGERDPQHATVPTTWRLTGDNNDELFIWQH